MSELAALTAKVAAVEALASRWADVLAECKASDPRWITDRSVTTLDTALDELRHALREHSYLPVRAVAAASEPTEAHHAEPPAGDLFDVLGIDEKGRTEFYEQIGESFRAIRKAEDDAYRAARGVVIR